MHNLDQKNVLVMGLGRFGGGIGVAQYLASNNANVTITDLLPTDQLTNSLEQLQHLNLKYRLGEHRIEDFQQADLIVVNPAVDPDQNKYLRAAKEANIPLTSEIQLLLPHLNPARTIGITGTAGKSTTTAMLGHILKQTTSPDTIHVGGNIGGSLLTQLHRIEPDHLIVLELSSFMLEHITNFAPAVSIVTNLSDNHLDRHKTLEAYAAAKQNLINKQTPDQLCILGPSVHDWQSLTNAKTILTDQTTADQLPDTFLVPGPHNKHNALMALHAAEYFNIAHADALTAAITFPGLPHRLQCVHERNNIRYYNDSKCTTPTAALLALNAFPDKSVHLILGGYDKKADLQPLARHAAQHAAAIYTIGQTAPTLTEHITLTPSHCPLHHADTLENAMTLIQQNVKPNQNVVLSPACASWDQFENYEQRGERFTQLAKQNT